MSGYKHGLVSNRRELEPRSQLMLTHEIASLFGESCFVSMTSVYLQRVRACQFLILRLVMIEDRLCIKPGKNQPS
jgi:hypothetical protein